MLKKIICHKDKIYLMQLALLQILISFITNYIVVKQVGFTGNLDIYYLSMSVYLFLTTSINWSISAVLTPILIEHKEKHLEGSMYINILIIVIPLFLFALSTLPLWINIIYINYLTTIDKETIKIIQIIFLVSFLFDSLNLIYFAIMQSKNQYIYINVINLLASIISLITVYIFITKYGIYAAAYSQLILRVFIFITLTFFLFSAIKKSFYFNKNNFFLLWNRMKYILGGSLYFRLGDVVDKIIASFLAHGFLSLASFIQKIYESSNTVINSSIVAPTITKFSILIKNEQYSLLKKTIIKYLFFLFVVNTIGLLIILIFGKDLFLYFFSNKISAELMPILSITLIALFVIAYSQTLGKILQNVLLSLKEEKLITKFDVISFSINIIIKIILTYLFSIYGFLISIVLGETLKYGLKGYLAYSLLNDKHLKATGER